MRQGPRPAFGDAPSVRLFAAGTASARASNFAALLHGFLATVRPAAASAITRRSRPQRRSTASNSPGNRRVPLDYVKDIATLCRADVTLPFAPKLTAK